jgi:DNA topoisomerase-1
MSTSSITGTSEEKRLYDLIWKRTLASQMADAVLEKTTVTIDISKSEYNFIATGEVIIFDGFLKVYLEGNDDDTSEENADLLPPVKNGQPLNPLEIIAQQRFTRGPARYTEASLVKKLEELGIGRPSTYAPTISTILKREYVVKEDRQGQNRSFNVYKLVDDKISSKTETETFGFEKAKLFPTDIGILVNKFLFQYFESIIDYNFTANVEKEFDEIAEGRQQWNSMIREFYGPFHKKIEDTNENSAKFSGEKLLGVDPVSGKNLFVKVGRFGPMVQLGDTDSEEKPKFAGLNKTQTMESLTLADALELFSFPRLLGLFEDKEMTVAIGRFGPYVKHDAKFYSLSKTDDPATVDAERAVEVIVAKREKEQQGTILEFHQEPELKVLNGRYGPYITFKKSNYKIPKGTDPSKLSLDDCKSIIANPENAPKKAFKGKRK